MLSVLALVAAVLVARAVLAMRSRWPRRRLALAAMVPLALCALAAVTAPEPYQIRKLLGTLIMPTGLVWIALAAFGWTLAESGHRRPAAIVVGLWIAFGIAGNVWVGQRLLNRLEAPFVAINPFAQDALDAVVVLGGGVSYHEPSDTVSLGASGARAVLAARLYHAGITELLVASGPVRTRGSMILDYPERTAELWQQLAVPPEAIIRLRGPRTTSEEIAALAPMTGRAGWRRLGLITSAFHMRRALALCDRHGLEVVPLPAHFAGGTLMFEPRYLIPQGEGFESVETAAWELAGAALGQ